MGWFRTSLNDGSHTSATSRQRNRPLVVEKLEERRVLSHAIQPVASVPALIATNVITGRDGNLWVGTTLGGFAPTSFIDRVGLNGSVTPIQVPVPAGAQRIEVDSLANGPDGNVWFDASADLPTGGGIQEPVIGKVTPAGQVTEFPPLPVAPGFSALTASIVAGPSGALWFGYSLTTNNPQDLRILDVIGRVSTSGAIKLFPVSSFSVNTGLLGTLAAGSDGNVWFTTVSTGAGVGNELARLSPSGVVTPISLGSLILPTVGNGALGTLILAADTPKLQRQVFTVSTAPVFAAMPAAGISHVPLPARVLSAFESYLGTAAGSLWFTNATGPSYLGRIAPNGAITAYNVSRPIAGHQNTIQSMTVGPDGNIYLLVTNLSSSNTATVYRLSPNQLPPVRTGSSLTLR